MPGVFSLMLHSHIPYCRKSGVWPAGEEWLFEAMNETYIPLLQVLRGFKSDGIPARLTIGIVPVLAEQLADPYMKQRFHDYMEDKIRRAENDARRFQADPRLRRTAEYWRDLFQSRYQAYIHDFYTDVLGTLKWLQDENVIEVATSAATHGFLPLMARDSSIFAQVRLGGETYRKYLGRPPRGIWLPECAYRPAQWSDSEKRERQAIDHWLADEGLRYFFVETSGLERAAIVDNRFKEDRPTTYRGYRLPSGVAVFGRNEATGKQVWSPEGGYPGDPDYLEFHWKDAESGLLYYRVTGRPEKEVYDPDRARQKAADHATHFVSLLERLAAEQEATVADPLIVAPYDCELFGHWWHEGPLWIDGVFRELSRRDHVRSLSLGDVVDAGAEAFSTIRLGPTSWGLGGDFTVWLNPEHGWIWPYINACAREFEEILTLVDGQGRPNDDRGRRILRQLARELLLMQGSDWPFLLFTEQAKEYANQRFHHHHQRFRRLAWAARDLGDHSRLGDHDLAQFEDVDRVFDDLDYNLFRGR